MKKKQSSHLVVLQVPDDAGHLGVPADGHRNVGHGGQELRTSRATLRSSSEIQSCCGILGSLAIERLQWFGDSDCFVPFLFLL